MQSFGGLRMRWRFWVKETIKKYRHCEPVCLQTGSKQSLRHTAPNRSAHGFLSAGIQVVAHIKVLICPAQRLTARGLKRYENLSASCKETIRIPVRCSIAQRLLRSSLQAAHLAMTSWLVDVGCLLLNQLIVKVQPFGI